MTSADSTWSPRSWRDKPAAQQPDWPDEAALEAVLKQMGTLPPLVFAGEARALTEALGHVARGEAFLLQAGDCAESFEAFSADAIRDKLKVPTARKLNAAPLFITRTRLKKGVIASLWKSA